MKNNNSKNAIILAAGFGMRMVPINLNTPKAFLTVNGEKLIERVIKQLHEVGIYEIHIVVGFMKEKFEYLIDKYGVDLIVNPQYASHNNISSLALASNYIRNTYIIPSDVWCKKNPFCAKESNSWYMISDAIDANSNIKIGSNNRLIYTNHGIGNKMIGISYLCGNIAEIVKKRILIFNNNVKYNNLFWEEALYNDLDVKTCFLINAKVIPHAEISEINTYEQLRELDSHSNELHSTAMETIADVFQIQPKNIINISVLKKGMTNRSFIFQLKRDGNVGSSKYIMRVPGEGTDKLINRQQEATVYQTISGKGLCDDPIYLNPRNGYKITKFLEESRTCNPNDDRDLKRCIILLHSFHDMGLKVEHTFDIFEKIRFYKSLWGDSKSRYSDHCITTENIFKLKNYIDSQHKQWCLTHIDAVPDNFLFYKNSNSSDGQDELLQLTDWEYSGMQDPHVDIAMFCLYAMYDKKQVDYLIDLYFQGNCLPAVRTKIYCYIAICGLLWSNWCEFKMKQGVEFGEYSLRQYQFAKAYYRYAIERM